MNYERNVFHQAIDSLLGEGKVEGATWIAEQIALSQKFIVPDAGKMTEGRPFDDMKDSLRLPFQRVALIREISQESEISHLADLHIIVAVSPDVVQADDSGACAFYVADAYRLRGVRDWMPGGPIGVDLNGDLSGHGIRIHTLAGTEMARLSGEAALDVMSGALNGLTELLLMLSLANVTTRVVAAPAKLNKKRRSNGNRPLYDYHVLLIDGQDVSRDDAPGSATDRQIRSHFRRGHIRRLDEERRVWVRATFVRGHQPGFVDKDYKVTT